MHEHWKWMASQQWKIHINIRKQNTYRRNTSSCKFKVNIVVCCWDQVKNAAQKYYKSLIASTPLPFKVSLAVKGACSPTHSSRSSSCPTVCCKMATETSRTSLAEVNSSTIRSLWPAIPSIFTSPVVSGGSVAWKRKFYKQIKLIVYLLVLKISCVQVNHCIKLIMA